MMDKHILQTKHHINFPFTHIQLAEYSKIMPTKQKKEPNKTVLVITWYKWATCSCPVVNNVHFTISASDLLQQNNRIPFVPSA